MGKCNTACDQVLISISMVPEPVVDKNLLPWDEGLCYLGHHSKPLPGTHLSTNPYGKDAELG